MPRSGAGRDGRPSPYDADAAVTALVEFPAGPLAIGDDDLVEPVELRVGRTRVPALSATDSCRDRLAAFYHWRDLQSLRVASRSPDTSPSMCQRFNRGAHARDTRKGSDDFSKNSRSRGGCARCAGRLVAIDSRERSRPMWFG